MGMSDNPVVNDDLLVSIVTPVFNESRFIRIALDSLVRQTYRNIEIIVSDNCSTDGTWEIMQEFAARDPRIKTHRQPHNVGMVENGRTTFQMAKGEFIMGASGNDYWCPSFVSACVAELLKDPAVVLAYPKAVEIDFEGNKLDLIPTNLDTRGMSLVSRVNVILWGLGHYYQMCGLFRKSVWDSCDHKTVLSPDGVILMQAAVQGVFAQIPEVLLHKRVAEKDMSGGVVFRRHCDERSVPSELSPDQLYYEMMREYVGLVKQHFPPGIERNALITSIVLALATRHRANYQGASRAAAGAPPAPVRSDLEGVVERLAFEFDALLARPEDAGDVLHKTAREDVLRQFTTDELVSMMSYRELVGGVISRIKRAIRRRRSGRDSKPNSTLL